MSFESLSQTLTKRLVPLKGTATISKLAVGHKRAFHNDILSLCLPGDGEVAHIKKKEGIYFQLLFGSQAN